MMKQKICARLFTLALLLLASTAAASAQNCLSYEPAEVNLTGTILKKIFPGAPNYESIRRGDAPETIWILHLSRPTCVTGNTDETNVAEKRVTDVQLVLDGDGYTPFQKIHRWKNQRPCDGQTFSCPHGAPSNERAADGGRYSEE